LTKVLFGISGPAELRRLNQQFPDRYPYLLQSTAVGGELGRFDILFAFPGESLVLQQGSELSGHSKGKRTKFLQASAIPWRMVLISRIRTRSGDRNQLAAA